MNPEGFSYNLQQTESKSTQYRTGDTACQSHYAGPMTSRDVIGLPPVTMSLVTLCNCFLTMQDYTKDTQGISGTQLPYRRCERRIFVVVYSTTRDARQLCYYLLYCKVAFYTFESFHRSQF